MRFLEASKYYQRHFGIKTTADLIWKPRIFGRLFKKHFKYKDALLKWQKALINDILQKYRTVSPSVNSMPDNYYIFTCWWQGEDAMPEVIQECHKSLLSNAHGHRVITITKYNYTEYVDIPAYIIDKLHRGLISFSHFSDILRLSLLSVYGGLWIDTALYVTKPLPNYPQFFMPRGYPNESLCEGRWCFGVIASPKGFNLINFMLECLLKYWRCYKATIDYLMFDGFLRLGYENIPEISAIIDSLPIDSPNLHESRYTFMEEVNEKHLADLINANLFLSLTWRICYPKTTDTGSMTYYGALLKHNNHIND